PRVLHCATVRHTEPTTPQISTLSLHDALPISGAALTVQGKTMAESRTIRESVDHILLGARDLDDGIAWLHARIGVNAQPGGSHPDRKSTRLNSSHRTISYAVFCLKKKNTPCER